MIPKLFLSALVISLFFCACKKQQESIQNKIPMTEKSIELVKSGNSFGFKLFAAIPERHDQNTMLSPFSVSAALSMALNGAEGETKMALINALGEEGLTTDDVNQIYLDLVNSLKKADDKVILNIANSIWIRKGFPVLDSFKLVNQKFYDATIENLDFNPTAVSSINQWVNSKTNGKIPSILETIASNEIMFLINAIYFNGKWQIRFDPSKTEQTDFTLFDGEKNAVPMMKVKEKFAWVQQPGYKALKMPYGRGKFQMILLLPDEGNTPDQLVRELDRTKWESLVASMNNPSEIEVWLPKFEFSWESELKPALTSLGMGIAFSDQADFSGINPEYQLLITKVKHKTYLKVNEEGTEAAAVTSVGIGLTSYPANPAEFHVTRPFFFAITEEDTGALLFMGKVENPLLK